MSPLEIARLYLGKKEKSGNSGFEDPEFEKEMIALGEWANGYSWCCCFAQMIFRKAYPERSEQLKRMFDPSTRRTLNNYKAAESNIISMKPTLNALVIWGHYKNGILEWNGHAGIVSSVISQDAFTSIEGNTSSGGSSNGDRVFEHTRTMKTKSTGLNVLGFIII